MKLHANKEIAGYPITRICAFLRAFEDEASYRSASFKHLSLDPNRNEETMARLEQAGLLVWSRRLPDGRLGKGFWRKTELGFRLAATAPLRTTDLLIADRIFLETMERLRQAVANPLYPVDVSRLFVFGDYARSASRVTDLDLAIEFRDRSWLALARRVGGAHLRRYLADAATELGLDIQGRHRLLTWPETELIKTLKAGERLITFMPLSAIARERIPCIIAYQHPQARALPFGHAASGLDLESLARARLHQASLSHSPEIAFQQHTSH